MNIPAAQYVRMSTEHQQYSIENQLATIRSYARDKNFDVVVTYSDEARSGLQLKNRPGLQQLLTDVLQVNRRYKAILVYDVSRFGRFQDSDEAAHYEFVCKSAGAPLHYCAETFANDNSLPSMIMKSLKRVMAGEYSRELSKKSYEGQKRLSMLGFKMGGNAGYGLRRVLVDEHGRFKQVLRDGERKAIQRDRVVYAMGEPEEVAVVREIFRMFIEDGMRGMAIADRLNKRKIPFLNGSNWYAEAIERMLNNPKYAGCCVFGKISQKLHTNHVRIPPDQWIVTPGAFDAIVDPETFKKVRRIRDRLTINRTDEEMLESLRKLIMLRGRVPLWKLKDFGDLPNLKTYIRRFGSTRHVCELLGYENSKALAASDTYRQVRQLKSRLIDELIRVDPAHVSLERQSPRITNLELKSRGRVSVHVCRYYQPARGRKRYGISMRPSDKCDMFLVALLDRENKHIEKLQLIKRFPFRYRTLTVKPDDPIFSGSIVLRSAAELYSAAGLLARAKTKEVSKIRKPIMAMSS